MKRIVYLMMLIANLTNADQLDFWHEGWFRQTYLYVPSCISNDTGGETQDSVPLVFMIHGLGGTGADYYNFSALAEDSCFMVAFPSGLFNSWNIGPDAGYAHEIDDNSFLHALIDTIDNDYPLDTNRVYLTGHSMGGAMASHLLCTSTRFTAFGSSGGLINGGYQYGNDHEELCQLETGTYPNPLIITHGMLDEVVPYEWAIFTLYHFLLLNRCNGVTPWSYDYAFPIMPDIGIGYDDPYGDYQDIYDSVIGSADTITYSANGEIQRFRWSEGCLAGPSSLEALVIPGATHAWHMTWNSPINTPLEHWNYFRQFSKNEMGPVLNSITLPNGVNISDDYIANNEETLIGVSLIDNYSISSIKISFSGMINVEGFELVYDFNTDERFINTDIGISLDSSISSDYYETYEITLIDSDGNETIYNMEELQNLDLYQQFAVINSVTVSTNEAELTPKEFLLHQNYPNPFNPITSIGYDLPEDSHVSIKVFDLNGFLIKTLCDNFYLSGYKEVKWDGTNQSGKEVSASIYVYQIEAGEYVSTKKMALIK